MLHQCLNHQELVQYLNGRFYDQFLQSKNNIFNFFNSLNNSFILFSIIGLVLITCNSESKISKISTLQRRIQLSEERACMISTIFLLLERYKAIYQLFSELFFIQFGIQFFSCSFKTFTKIYGYKIFNLIISQNFKESSIFGIYNIIHIIGTKFWSV